MPEGKERLAFVGDIWTQSIRMWYSSTSHQNRWPLYAAIERLAYECQRSDPYKNTQCIQDSHFKDSEAGMIHANMINFKNRWHRLLWNHTFNTSFEDIHQFCVGQSKLMYMMQRHLYTSKNNCIWFEWGCTCQVHFEEGLPLTVIYFRISDLGRTIFISVCEFFQRAKHSDIKQKDLTFAVSGHKANCIRRGHSHNTQSQDVQLLKRRSWGPKPYNHGKLIWDDHYVLQILHVISSNISIILSLCWFLLDNHHICKSFKSE